MSSPTGYDASQQLPDDSRDAGVPLPDASEPSANQDGGAPKASSEPSIPDAGFYVEAPAGVDTPPVWSSDKELNALGRAWLSLGLDFVPWVGTGKGISEAIDGRDAITGEDLSWFQRALGVVPVIGKVSDVVKAGTKAPVSKLDEAAAAVTDDAVRQAEATRQAALEADDVSGLHTATLDLFDAKYDSRVPFDEVARPVRDTMAAAEAVSRTTDAVGDLTNTVKVADLLFNDPDSDTDGRGMGHGDEQDNRGEAWSADDGHNSCELSDHDVDELNMQQSIPDPAGDGSYMACSMSDHQFNELDAHQSSPGVEQDQTPEPAPGSEPGSPEPAGLATPVPSFEVPNPSVPSNSDIGPEAPDNSQARPDLDGPVAADVEGCLEEIAATGYNVICWSDTSSGESAPENSQDGSAESLPDGAQEQSAEPLPDDSPAGEGVENEGIAELPDESASSGTDSAPESEQS